MQFISSRKSHDELFFLDATSDKMDKENLKMKALQLHEKVQDIEKLRKLHIAFNIVKLVGTVTSIAGRGIFYQTIVCVCEVFSIKLRFSYFGLVGHILLEGKQSITRLVI